MKRAGLLEYQDYGHGPAVVLIHDAILTGESWHKQVEPLITAGFRVIIPELNGLVGKVSLGAYSSAIITLLNRLGLGRFAVCGMGMGGSIIQAMLASCGSRITGACFINTRPGGDDVHEKLKRAQVIELLSTEADQIREELLTALMGDREESFTAAVREQIRAEVFNYSISGLQYNLEAMQGRENYIKFLQQLDLPVLIVAGSDDNLCHSGYAKLLADLFVDCRDIISLEGGHLIQLEAADAVNSALVEFLQGIVPSYKIIDEQCALRAA